MASITINFEYNGRLNIASGGFFVWEPYLRFDWYGRLL
ncbi:hypothetical protein l13_05840 [Neisseria weaveri ATCC 51223]|nr:hypothetical protein l13_05840 [Neisseria weaveri ATCC 51223]